MFTSCRTTILSIDALMSRTRRMLGMYWNLTIGKTSKWTIAIKTIELDFCYFQHVEMLVHIENHDKNNNNKMVHLITWQRTLEWTASLRIFIPNLNS